MKVLFVILWTACCAFIPTNTISAQTAKIKLKPDDFGKWSTLENVNIAPNGKWVSYRLRYDSGNDTVFVREVGSAKKYFFPSGKIDAFSKNGKWFFANVKNGVHLQNLITGEQKIIPSARKAKFMAKGGFLLVRKGKKPQYSLLIQDLEKGGEVQIQNVKEYVLSPDKNTIAYIANDNRIGVYSPDAKAKNRILLSETILPRKNLIWNGESNALAFLEELKGANSPMPGHAIYFLKNIFQQKEKPIIKIFDGQELAKGKGILYKPSYTPLLIAPDNKRIFFYMGPIDLNNEKEKKVEIWNSKSRVEYDRGKYMIHPKNRPKLCFWDSNSNEFVQIASGHRPSVHLTPDKNIALTFDPFQYEPQPEIMGPSDMWLTDLITGKQKLFLKKQTQQVGRLGVSPNSRYLNYFRQKHWWVYDIHKAKHIKVSAGLDNMENTKVYRRDLPPPYGFAGWTKDSQFLILYSQYDIWLVSANGKKQEKLTNGSANGVRYRLVFPSRKQQSINMYDINAGKYFDLNKGLIVEAFNTKNKSSGYYKWTKEKGLTKLVFKDAKLDHLKKASRNNTFVWVKQKSNLSPQIIYLDENKGQKKLLVRTNEHQDKYKWGKSELISYKNADGQKLQGVLRFPAGYQPGKKYPMIVHIYEDQSYLLHKYHNPSFYNPGGFSPSNYTTDGYFVLHASITYELGEPGYSALDCVEAAVKKVLGLGIVEKNRIGLIGHSFGGYEATFIATQSKMFRTVVAGAALTDLVSHSLTLNFSGRSQMWRYQTHQLRMGNALYEDYDGFVENSPITYAQNINIPLLNWTGKNDLTVDPQQSKALHMAMRSLKKKHVLLLYPNERHILLQPSSQKDLTEKIKAWFDHYLKGVPLPASLGGKNKNAG